jgi:hypothetical protein
VLTAFIALLWVSHGGCRVLKSQARSKNSAELCLVCIEFGIEDVENGIPKSMWRPPPPNMSELCVL